MLDSKDWRLLRLEGAEYLVPAASVPNIDALLQRHDPSVDYSIEPIPPPKDPLAAGRRAEIDDAASRMPYDDGDALPEGHYVADKEGNLVRVGPAEVKRGWHGTVAPSGTALDLELRAPMVDGRPHLREIPSIYSTTDPLIAQRVAFNRWRRQRNEGKGDEQSPQLYEVVATPSETVELGDCKDKATVTEAINRGADVLECPDWEPSEGNLVPEVIVLNDDVHHTGRAWQLDPLSTKDIPLKLEKAEQALRSNNRIGPSIRRSRGMPRHTRFKDLPVKAKPRRNGRAGRGKYQHPILRKGK